MTGFHTFHIPVMGIGFTIDTPLKVAHLGISSVVSLVDDILMEKLRKFYSLKNNLPWTEIKKTEKDHRAKRITAYLNMLDDLCRKKLEDIRSNFPENRKELEKYFRMMPGGLSLPNEGTEGSGELEEWLNNVQMGSIDVNIMTKLDRENTYKKEPLPVEYNDAHSALRGYANSKLHSSLVFSAGMSPRLYGYLEQFPDFYPDESGYIAKKIILKVSDFRSALIQGKYLAKRGIWVSEYRIESGLNCGGHAFATDGFLMGPILAEFRDKRDELTGPVFELFKEALAAAGRAVPAEVPQLKISAQGGVGTAAEHDFLLSHYKLDSVGWGTPFLLVPEATTVDDETLKKLAAAKEKDVELSEISPLGVPFYNLIHNTKDEERDEHILKGRPGSSCPKKYLAINKEFTDSGICTASRQYQDLKLNALAREEISPEDYQQNFEKVTVKSCICVGLGTAALIKYGLDTRSEGKGVSVCPGPNIAHFSKIMTLEEMTDHIYGRADYMDSSQRQHMFIKELDIYLEYLEKKIREAGQEISKKTSSYFSAFIQNLTEGMEYYKSIVPAITGSKNGSGKWLKDELLNASKKLELIRQKTEVLVLA